MAVLPHSVVTYMGLTSDPHKTLSVILAQLEDKRII